MSLPVSSPKSSSPASGGILLNPLRLRKVLGFPTEALWIVRMFRNTQVVNSRADVLRRHRVKKGVSADSCFLFINQNWVQMIGMAGVGRWFGR
jgi:hypothetical protein